MKRAKDKYMINRTKYKDIKRYDHKRRQRMSRQSRELKKQQERAKKYGCDGRCYWSTGMCPSVEICDETRVGEAIATAIGLITVLAMIAMVPIIVIGGAIMLIWSIFAG